MTNRRIIAYNMVYNAIRILTYSVGHRVGYSVVGCRDDILELCTEGCSDIITLCLFDGVSIGLSLVGAEELLGGNSVGCLLLLVIVDGCQEGIPELPINDGVSES